MNVAFTALISIKRPSFSPIITVQPLANMSDNLPIFDGVLDYGGASGRTYTGVNPTRSDSLCLTAASDLALFSGAGTIGLPAEAIDLSSQTGASSWSIGPKAYASVKVTYNDQECTVPADRTSWGRIKQTYRQAGRRGCQITGGRSSARSASASTAAFCCGRCGVPPRRNESLPPANFGFILLAEVASAGSGVGAWRAQRSASTDSRAHDTRPRETLPCADPR